MTTKPDHISVMLVDDSAVVRGILSKILESDPSIKIIESAQNGEAAVHALQRGIKPDIILLDIEMPKMDGITALPLLLKESPESKVIMCSTLTQKGADITMQAMKLGAVDCIGKPSSTSGLRQENYFRDHLIHLVKQIGPDVDDPAPDHKNTSVTAPIVKPNDPIQLYKDPGTYKGKPAIIAIGSSTGGPQALFEVIKSFKDFDIPIVITQHMPATFTRILADHITHQTGVPAHEGEDGMTVENGNVYVAPGGMHMIFEKKGLNLTIKLDDGPPENFCKPSVDTMYRSLMPIYGNKILATILTGMGHDGLAEGKNLVQNGVRLIAQDKATSVVWGMPGAVASAGICSDVLPLKEIGPAIRKAVKGL